MTRQKAKRARRASVCKGVNGGQKGGPKWRPLGPFSTFSLSFLAGEFAQNGPEQSRARRCWARPSGPLTARTALPPSAKKERLLRGGSNWPRQSGPVLTAANIGENGAGCGPDSEYVVLWPGRPLPTLRRVLGCSCRDSSWNTSRPPWVTSEYSAKLGCSGPFY